MRWISADPARLIDGSNLYRYARNNPVSLLDPGGTDTDDLFPPPDDSGGWDWHYLNNQLGPTWIKVEMIEEQGTGWLGRVWGWLKWLGRLHWEAGKKPAEWTWDAIQTLGSTTRRHAGNLWDWAGRHRWLAAGAAVGIAALAAIFRRHLWNWVLAPAIRTATNAALGYAIGGTTGAWIGAGTGPRARARHGLGGKLRLGRLGDGCSFSSTTRGACSTAGSAPSSRPSTSPGTQSTGPRAGDSGTLHFERRIFPGYDSSLGNVAVGQQVPKHERVHVLQARLFGPAFYPLAILNFEVNAVLPWWLFFGRNTGDCGGILGFPTGVYRNTLHEIWAYRVDGKKC